MIKNNGKEQFFIWCIASISIILIYGCLIIGFLFFRTEQAAAKGGPEAIMLEFAEEPEAPNVETVSQTIQQAMIEENVEEQVEEQPKPEEVEKPIVEMPKSEMQEEVKKEVKKPEPPIKDKKLAEKPRPRHKNKREITDEQKAEREQSASGPQIVAKPGKTYAASHNNRESGAGGRELATWQSKVQRRIAFSASRSRTSRTNGRGVALISFKFDGNGNITNANIIRSSGNPAIDETALQAVKKATPIPTPPNGWTKPLTVPVEIK